MLAVHGERSEAETNGALVLYFTRISKPIGKRKGYSSMVEQVFGQLKAFGSIPDISH